MTNSDGNMVLDSLTDKAKIFLTEYIQTDYESIKLIKDDLNKLALNDYAVVIYANGVLSFTVMIGFEENLLENISKTFLNGQEIAENDKIEIYDSVAKETTNIIVGLSFESYITKGRVTNMTPPIRASDTIIKNYDNVAVFNEDLITKFGKLSISVM